MDMHLGFDTKPSRINRLNQYLTPVPIATSVRANVAQHSSDAPTMQRF